MLNVIVTAVVLIVNFILQSTVLQLIEIRGVIPDTMIIIIVSYALLRGQTAGFYALMGFLVGHFCGICHRNFYRENYILPVTLSVISNLIVGLVIYITGFLLKNNYDVFYYLLAVIVPQSVYTGIASIALYRLLYSINNKVEKKERETRRLF